MRAYDDWKNNDGHESTYKDARRKFKTCHRMKLSTYMSDIENGIINTPRNFWEFVKSRNESRSLPKSMTYRGAELQDDASIVAAFAENFKESYGTFFGTCPQIRKHEIEEITELTISNDVLLKALMHLDSKKGLTCCRLYF